MHTACPEWDTDYDGNNITPGSIADLPETDTWEQCGQMCNDERSCTHWTWLGNHVGDTFKRRCILKTSDNGVRSYAGVVSGDGNCTSLPLGWYNYIYILMLYLRPIIKRYAQTKK